MPQGESTINDPVMRMNYLRALLIYNATQLPDAKWIRHRRMMLPIGRVDTRQSHRGGGKSVNSYAGRKHHLVRNARHPLSSNRDFMAAHGKSISQVQHVKFFPAKVGREKLS